LNPLPSGYFLSGIPLKKYPELSEKLKALTSQKA
jgi:hypothetical protein